MRQGITPENSKYAEMSNLPLGLQMRLTQDPKAMGAFALLPRAQQRAAIDYIQDAASAQEAMSRISSTIQQLHDTQTNY